MIRRAPGFRLHRAGSRVLVVAEALEATVVKLGLLEPGGLSRLLASGTIRAGRARNAVVPLPGRDERLHLRPARHGGLLAPLLGDWLSGLGRPLAELAATARLAAAGAPVPRPVLAVGRQRAPGVWTAAVGTLHEEDSCGGFEFLSQCPGAERLLEAAAAVGGAVRRFHDAGGCHADLHAGNVLIRAGRTSPRAILVDLDRARVVAEVAPRRRLAEIMRLYRSLRKRGLHDALGPRVVARFLDAYTAGDESLRAALLAGLRREKLRLAIHELHYRLR